jgi:hypothetical protein
VRSSATTTDSVLAELCSSSYLWVFCLFALWAYQFLYIAMEDTLARGRVTELHQFRVEIKTVYGRADHDENRVTHLEQRHHHFVKDSQVHVRGLFAIDNLGTYTTQSVHNTQRETC